MEEVTVNPPNASQSSTILAYMQLFRLPVIFTAISELTAGFLFVNHSDPFANWPTYLCLLASTCFLYTAGMVLNDVFDFKIDLQERPERPLPSGKISLSTASTIGFLFLAAGTIAGSVSGFVAPNPIALPWRGMAIAVSLAAMIIAYDLLLKKTILGPVAMGGCRFLNILLGMSAAATLLDDATFFVSYSPDQLIVASGIGIYIVGLTIFARTEAKVSNNSLLTLALLIMVAGIVLFGLFPYNSLEHALPLSVVPLWPFMIFVFIFTIGRRCYGAITDPTPYRVQITVKQCLFSLILFDATIVLVVMEPQWAYSLAILALAFPMLFLSRWLQST